MSEPKPSSYVTFDGMTWPHPDDPAGVEWQLRYGHSEIVRLTAASYVEAYRHLIKLPERSRNLRIKMLRKMAKGAKK